MWYAAIMHLVVLFRFDRLFVECLSPPAYLLFTAPGVTEKTHQDCRDTLDVECTASIVSPSKIQVIYPDIFLYYPRCAYISLSNGQACIIFYREKNTRSDLV